MSIPIQGDKPLTLNSDRGQRSSAADKSGAGSAAPVAQSAAAEAPQASTEVSIEKGSQLYSSATRQADAATAPAITTREDATNALDRLKELLTEYPSQAMQAQSGHSSEQVTALLHA